MSDSIASNLRNDTVFQLGFSIAIVVYSVISMTKLIGSVKSLVNRLIVLSLISFLVTSLLLIVNNTLILNNAATNDATNLAFGAMISIFNIIGILSFIFVVNLRNNILIENKEALILTKVLIFVTVLVSIPFLPINSLVFGSPVYSNNPTYAISSSVLSTLIFVFTSILDIISNIYLLVYYKKYYFSSSSIMKHLRFQMIYRRNWIYFVTFLILISFGCIVMAALNVFSWTASTFLNLVTLLELNTMIDFVKFDAVRNEIVIGSDTIYIFDNK